MFFEFIIVRKIFAKYRLHDYLDIEFNIVATKHEIVTKDGIKIKLRLRLQLVRKYFTNDFSKTLYCVLLFIASHV